MIEFTLTIINLVKETFETHQTIGYITVLIRIIEVVTSLPKIISYLDVTKPKIIRLS